MKKRIISIMLTAVLLMVGCGKAANNRNKTSGRTKAQTVTVWAWDKNFNIPIMEEAAKI